MMPFSAEIAAIGKVLWPRVYKKCRDVAKAEIANTFKGAWRGGKWQWQYSQSGHGFELQQTGVQNFSTSDLTITTDLFTAAPITYPIGYDLTTANPRVYAQSQDTDWVATAYPTPGNEHTQITVALKRADSRTLIQFGHVSGTILSGTDHVDVSTGTFPSTFAATPVVDPNTDNTLTRVNVLTVSTSSATFRVSYVPTTAAGQITYSKTGLGDPTGVAEVTNYSATGVGTGDNSDGTDTGDNSDGTDTDAASGPGSHSHGHNASGGHHTHPHNTSGGHHTHPINEPSAFGNTGHNHTLTEPTVGSDHGHKHDFTGDAENAPSDTAFTLHWVALGGRVVIAANVDLCWASIGIQSS